MSALEYKIHHYTEIYKKLRTTKCQVVLQNNLTTEATATVTANGAPLLVKTNNATVVLNGYHGSLSATSKATTAENVSTTVPADGTVSPCCDSDDACSRTRPLLRSKFRKRNIIRLDEAQNGVVNGAYTKYASIRCDCVPPLSCVLCVNRGPGVDLSNQHVCANLLPVQSKIALLEPTYHPVLSFPQGEYERCKVEEW